MFWQKEKKPTNSKSEKQISPSTASPSTPEEILLTIFQYLTFRELGVVASVSKQWHRISEDNQLWHEFPAIQQGLFKYNDQLLLKQQVKNYATSPRINVYILSKEIQLAEKHVSTGKLRQRKIKKEELLANMPTQTRLIAYFDYNAASKKADYHSSQYYTGEVSTERPAIFCISLKHGAQTKRLSVDSIEIENADIDEIKAVSLKIRNDEIYFDLTNSNTSTPSCSLQ
jgi:hypothetical protein